MPCERDAPGTALAVPWLDGDGEVAENPVERFGAGRHEAPGAPDEDDKAWGAFVGRHADAVRAHARALDPIDEVGASLDGRDDSATGAPDVRPLLSELATIDRELARRSRRP